MTFKEYIKQRPVTETPTGDFVRDAQTDDTFPEGEITWEKVEQYLRVHHATPDAIKAARSVWIDYVV